MFPSILIIECAHEVPTWYVGGLLPSCSGCKNVSSIAVNGIRTRHSSLVTLRYTLCKVATCTISSGMKSITPVYDTNLRKAFRV